MHGNARVQAAIQEIVRRLVADLRPHAIILFGSHAYGEPDADSDIDLLIIRPTAEGFLERIAGARRVATGAQPRIPFDPIVLTPREVEQRLRAGDQFIAEIVRRGEVLYAA